jgi:hypothetical protein
MQLNILGTGGGMQKGILCNKHANMWQENKRQVFFFFTIAGKTGVRVRDDGEQRSGRDVCR